MHANDGFRGRRWIFADCEYFERGRQLLVAGGQVRIEAKPLDVLQIFLEHSTELLTKDQLLGEAWDIATSDQSLAVAVSKLRRAFGGSRDRILLSVPGVGYRMAVLVTCVEDNTPPPPEFLISPGDPIPSRPQWIAVRFLDLLSPHQVWLAEHSKTREARVFKFAIDGIRLRALQREVALSRLFAASFPNRPHFVRITDWNFDQSPYFTEAPFAGMNLFEFAETSEFAALTADERALLIAQISSAVADAHSIAVLHNDLKPSNILVCPRNGAVWADEPTDPSIARWQVKVVDFGIASLNELGHLENLGITDHGQFLEEPSHTSPRSPRGSPLYRAPELRRDGTQPDTRADIYALGVMLFQVLCGDLSAPIAPGWEEHIADPLLQRDISDACNLNPALRTASAAEFAHNLRHLPERRADAARIEQKDRDRARMEEELVRARVRQPWIAATIAALALGIVGTSWFFYRAVQQRNQALAHAHTLAAMNRFLIEDLITQINPTASPHRAPVEQETLLDAIRHAEPKIDNRFAQHPEIAAEIHEALGSAFGAMSSYDEAHHEYKAAAQHFEETQGPLSQDALQAELRNIVLLYIEQTPQALAAARASMAAIKPTLAQINNPTAQLQGWQTMAITAEVLSSNLPAEPAIPLLERAILQAHATPGYDPDLLAAMKLRLCGVYLKANRGGDAVRLAQTTINNIRSQEGADSPRLFVPETYLEEGLLEENRAQEAEVQSAQDYAQFLRLLGPESRFTLSALDVHAQVEEALHRYPQAIQDWLELYRISADNHSAQFFNQTAIVEAGQIECHSGSYTSGEQHLQQGLDQINTHGGVKALNFSVGSLALAECLLAQEEDGQAAARPASLSEIKRHIDAFDLPVVRSFAGTDAAPGYLYLAKGRLAFQQHDFAQARYFVQQAQPIIKQPTSDSWERDRMMRLNAALHERGF